MNQGIGKIVVVGDNIGGTSKTTGKMWVNKTIVVETGDTTPKKLAFTVTGEDRVGDCEELKVGDLVRVRFEPRSREWEGRWFSELIAWHFEVMSQPSKSTVSKN